MNAPFQSRSLLGCVLACVLGLLVSEQGLAQNAQPAITSIRAQGTNIVVKICVPAGFQRVTLEARGQLASGAWLPCAVALTGPDAGTLTLVVPRTRHSEILRVRAESTVPLPGTFYTGTNQFWEPYTGVDPNIHTFGDGVTTTGGPGTPEVSREVVESDIWKLRGDRLFFFNQYRGLQVIDIRNPDKANITGTLPLPAAGEQMYLAGENHVVLLTRNSCGSEDGSQVRIVSVAGELPVQVASLPVPGYIQESRMVGSALYVASQTYRIVPGTGGTTWEWGTLVSAYDLAKPGTPLARGTLWYPGYGNVVAATDSLLFVVTQNPTNYWQSLVRIIDITSADGAMAPYGSLATAGQVLDKFKLNYSGGILTTISEDRRNTGTSLVTRLETFRVPDPRSAGPLDIVRLGKLELGNGEQLHATRFDGDRVYVVTFFRIDPLWVVDLSEPLHPRIAGAVDVPGWSTYIQPLGNRLLTVGVENSRVAVSLFSVENVATPALLSRVLLGQNYSWSEANNDEKAFTFLPDANLVLVPYSGDTTNGWTSRVQLIDLIQDRLVARGIIQHQCQPRRAAFTGVRILSLSGWELLSVDATDRDQPQVRGSLELAWTVDRVLAVGDYVLEISGASSWWGRQEESVVRVCPANNPGLVLGRLELGSWPVTGAELTGRWLYVAQNSRGNYVIGPAGDGLSNEVDFVTTVIDLNALPNLSVRGSTRTKVEQAPWGYASWRALWPRPDVLVWAESGGGWGWGPWLYPVTPGVTDVVGGPVRFGFGGGRLLAFDVAKADPVLVSRVALTGTNRFGFNDPVVAGSLVYVSYNTREPVPTGTATELCQRSWLSVIDYAHPADPGLRKPVNIPGRLLGLSHNGEMLYTSGYRWTTNAATLWQEWLDASAYDGITAHRVDSLPMPSSWPHALLLSGPNVFLASPSTRLDTASKLEVWRVGEDGKFELKGAVALSLPATAMIERKDLLVLQATDASLWLFDIRNPLIPVPVGQDKQAGCLGMNLDLADGSLGGGLWLPLGLYGTAWIPPAPQVSGAAQNFER